MKTQKMKTKSLYCVVALFGILSAAWMAGCAKKESANPARTVVLNQANSLHVVLTPMEGQTAIDRKINEAQKQVRGAAVAAPELERLGWLFVAKARESFDPGYYKLAEICANLLEPKNHLESLLLLGHVRHNLHEFKAAEPLARELTEKRGLAYDFGLLSDVLMEQGKLEEASVACQRMLDLRPDLHSYARGAQLRWLKGDLEGARELMGMAVSAASPQDAEAAAWVSVRLAQFNFLAGKIEEARAECEAALAFETNYPPALLLQGRLLLAEGRSLDAVSVLTRAAGRNAQPEYQWTLAEALRSADRQMEAREVESQLMRHGRVRDRRTYSLFLATRGDSGALSLAIAEMKGRADVFTHDALAWALQANGQMAEASEEMARALAEGTKDARLFYHAAVIEQGAKHDAAAQRYFREAIAMKQALLPCERERLEKMQSQLATGPAGISKRPS